MESKVRAAARPKKAASKLKTQPNDASVISFLNGITDERRRKDAFAVLELMKKVTKTAPKMWGASIVGFGVHEYRYASGGGGTWFLTGFSPRKAALTLYIMTGLEPHSRLLKSLGKHKTGKGCLYIRSLDDIDLRSLDDLVRDSVARLNATRTETASGV